MFNMIDTFTLIIPCVMMT